jgi:hypothetical protein
VTADHPLEPSGQGTVMLTLGEGIGALIVHTSGTMQGREIEVSPVDDPAVRTQATVRPRYLRGGLCWSVVIDSLPAGWYLVWRDPVTAVDEVHIVAGAVTQIDWP